MLRLGNAGTHWKPLWPEKRKVSKRLIMNNLQGETATKQPPNAPYIVLVAVKVRRKSADIALVAVLVAVGFRLSCFLVQLGARGYVLVSVAVNRLMRLYAIQCKSLQNAKKLTQNPPRATSWGFAPPSRHQ